PPLERPGIVDDYFAPICRTEMGVVGPEVGLHLDERNLRLFRRRERGDSLKRPRKIDHPRSPGTSEVAAKDDHAGTLESGMQRREDFLARAVVGEEADASVCPPVIAVLEDIVARRFVRGEEQAGDGRGTGITQPEKVEEVALTRGTLCTPYAID